MGTRHQTKNPVDTVSGLPGQGYVRVFGLNVRYLFAFKIQTCTCAVFKMHGHELFSHLFNHAIAFLQATLRNG